MQLRYKMKIKSEEEESKQTLRYQIKGEWNKISLQTQLEGNQYNKEKIRSFSNKLKFFVYSVYKLKNAVIYNCQRL